MERDIGKCLNVASYPRLKNNLKYYFFSMKIVAGATDDIKEVLGSDSILAILISWVLLSMIRRLSLSFRKKTVKCLGILIFALSSAGKEEKIYHMFYICILYHQATRAIV